MFYTSCRNKFAIPSNMRFCASILASFVCVLNAQPQLRVDPTQSRRPINPDIYGINEYGVASGGKEFSLAGKYPFTLRRWGGDNSVSYNWKLDANNLAGNWYFETFHLRPPGSAQPERRAAICGHCAHHRLDYGHTTIEKMFV